MAEVSLRARKCSIRRLGFVLVLLLPGVGCQRGRPVPDWTGVLESLEQKYASDARLAVFDLDVRAERGTLVIEGEVDSAAAKTEVLDRLAAVSGLPVADRILLLPDPRLAGKECGIVTVAVANVRRKPQHSAELVSQVLLGTTVRLLRARDGWLCVQCPDRYLGWINEDALVQTGHDGCEEWRAADKLIVTSPCGALRERPNPAAPPVSDLTTGNLLRRVSERGAWLEASLPDGRSGFIVRDTVERYLRWLGSRRLTAKNIENSARVFLGVPYLWGGTSARGFDCSGFVKTVFLLNGVELMRDADQQAREGEDIQPGPGFENLKRGDLLFFGRTKTAEQPERIWHVGIYLADREFIHCAGRVRVSSLDPAVPHYDAGHARAFVRARRFVHSQPDRDL